MRFHNHHNQRLPTACSTPNKQSSTHSKKGSAPSKQMDPQNEYPKPRNMKERRASSPPPPPPISVGGAMLGNGDREGLLGITENAPPPLPPLPPPLPPNRRAKPHRRLHTEPSGRILGGDRLPPPPSGGGATKGKKGQQTSSTNLLSSHQQPLPPPPPPLFHPFCNPYNFPYFPPPPYPFPFYPQLFPPDWTQEHAPFPYVPPQNSETEALDLATPFRYPHGQYPYGQYSQGQYPQGQGHPLDYYNSYYRNIFSNAKLHSQPHPQPHPQPQGSGRVSTGPPPKQEQLNSKQVDERQPKRQQSDTALIPSESHSRDTALRPSDQVETEPPAEKTTLRTLEEKILSEVLTSCEERVMSVRSQCGKDPPPPLQQCC